MYPAQKVLPLSLIPLLFQYPLRNVKSENGFKFGEGVDGIIFGNVGLIVVTCSGSDTRTFNCGVAGVPITGKFIFSAVLLIFLGTTPASIGINAIGSTSLAKLVAPYFAPK